MKTVGGRVVERAAIQRGGLGEPHHCESCHLKGTATPGRGHQGRTRHRSCFPQPPQGTRARVPQVRWWQALAIGCSVVDGGAKVGQHTAVVSAIAVSASPCLPPQPTLGPARALGDSRPISKGLVMILEFSDDFIVQCDGRMRPALRLAAQDAT
jgi:hypothetical protein